MKPKQKTCTKCRKTLDISFFYKNKDSKDGYRPSCKICEKDKRKNPDLNDIFFSENILGLSKFYKMKKISRCGYALGLMLIVRKGEIFVYSVLKGSTVVKTEAEGRAWLYHQTIKAADRIRRGFVR